MKRTAVSFQPEAFPEILHPLIRDCDLYDSSCSPEAKVWLADKQGGFFLKTAPLGTLEAEAAMTGFFHQKGLGPEVLHYLQTDRDWLVTRRIPGEDCTHPDYLSDPKRLSETTALLLRQLHETAVSGCPVPDRTGSYVATAQRNFRERKYDDSLFPDNWGYSTAEEAWSVVQENMGTLKTEVLLHGDYCLPNILLDNWRHAGFIDLGSGGVGDRHIDLFWGIWSLFFNLKTDAWGERFLDAYGRDKIEPQMLRVIAAFEVFG